MDREALVKRVAEVVLDEIQVSEDLEKQWAEAEKILPPSIRQRLRRAFTPRGMPFFEFYILLKRINLGQPITENLRIKFRKVTMRLNQVRSPVDRRSLSPAVTNQIALSLKSLNRFLGQLEQTTNVSPVTWRMINDIYVPLLTEVARDKGVYLKTIQRGAERWGEFRRMSGQQEHVEQMRDVDPESYALMHQMQRTLKEIDGGIEEQIRSDGKQHRKGFLMGRPVHYGMDKVTGEEMIYDRDGDILPKDAFIAKRKREEAAKLRLSKAKNRINVNPNLLRKLDDVEVDNLEGSVEWVALTDDKAKQGRLTRFLPTKRKPVLVPGENGEDEIHEYQVVTEDRYKGIYLDDLINASGRMVEGTAYTFNPKTKEGQQAPPEAAPWYSSDPLSADLSKEEREPYVTVADVVVERRSGWKKVTQKEERMFLKIPGTKPFTEVRNALKKLSCNHEASGVTGCLPSLVWQPVKRRSGKGARATGFYFEPKDFALIFDTLKGMSMSKQALGMLRSYYQELARAEQATQSSNLEAYTAPNLGGFKARVTNPVTGITTADPIFTVQKKAMAWMDANGNSGVCALETGVGKTLTAIGMMQKLVRDGFMEDDSTYTTETGKTVTTNGRLLWVCPKSLKGNLPKEIRAFLQSPRDLLTVVDVITYNEFSRSSKSKKPPTSIKAAWKGQRWDPSKYVAIFFDEAQALKNPLSKGAQAALSLWHPRKICLTASPMQKNPMEAYVLAAISNNTPLVGKSPEATTNRKEMRRFKERFCESVGGRVIGVSQDPLVKRDLDVWVKRNIFNADKVQVYVEEMQGPLANLHKAAQRARDRGALMFLETAQAQLTARGSLDPDQQELLNDLFEQYGVQREAYRLPALSSETIPVIMTSDVEAVYRGATLGLKDAMRGLVTKFRDKGIDRNAPKADHPDVERAFGRAFKPLLSLLNNLSNRPDQAFRDIAFMLQNGTLPTKDVDGNYHPIPDFLDVFLRIMKARFTPESLVEQAGRMHNPKMHVATEHVRKKLDVADGSSKTLLFSDDPDMCMETGQYMSNKIPGWHAVALADFIHVFEAGSPKAQIEIPTPKDLVLRLIKDEDRAAEIIRDNGGMTIHKLPFRRKMSRRFPQLPAHDLNTHFKADNWQQFAFQEILSRHTSVKTATLLGQSYQFGHNLQAFSTVIHLDRDTWNSESMKQRTARAWRQGQENAVDEITIDTVYSPYQGGVPTDEFDATLDEIRGFFQEIEGAVFDRIIKDAQGVKLGKEWNAILQRDASMIGLDKKVLDLMASPYVGRSQSPRV